jgi:hypothetical protein
MCEEGTPELNGNDGRFRPFFRRKRCGDDIRMRRKNKLLPSFIQVKLTK